MKKYFLILFVVLFLAGCSSTNETSTAGRFIGGTTGLEIEFIEGEPPLTVGDKGEDEFDIGVLAKNIGESDIESGKLIVTLQGIEGNAFSLASLSQKSTSKLEKRTKINDKITEPDQTDVRFKNAKYKYDLDSDFPQVLRADVCYEYQTKAVADLCLKKKPNDQIDEDQCELNNADVTVENSGAPVHIISMGQVPRSSSIKLTFDIMVQGTGLVYAPGAFSSECGMNEDAENQIKVSLKGVGDIPISCSRLNEGNEGTVELISGTRTISCDINTAGLQESAFKKPISIELTYFYKDSIETQFTVENTDFI
ncbi:MAG: lipoprotein [Candidatus Nanoarchaeia archaeon]|nr:lipoprotein [Candidatus Nanoarchaeia archaeon]